MSCTWKICSYVDEINYLHVIEHFLSECVQTHYTLFICLYNLFHYEQEYTITLVATNAFRVLQLHLDKFLINLYKNSI